MTRQSKQTRLKSLPPSAISVQDRVRKDMGKQKEGRESFEALKNSIQQNGLFEPLVVVDLGEDKYRLVAGGRRLAALEQLEWETIPCHIFPIGTTEIEGAVIELLENYDRKDYSWQEETEARARIDALMKEKHGELPRGVTRDPTESGKIDSRWSTGDTAKVLGVDIRSVRRDIELSKAMEIFPEEIGKAPTKKAALQKLERIKAETGVPMMDKTDPTISPLQDAIRTKTWYKKDWRELSEKLKNWGPNLIILTHSPTEEDLEILQDILFVNGWIVWIGRPHSKEWKEAIYTYPAKVDTNPQELQKNYKIFSYMLKGKAVLNKTGRSAVFSFKQVPLNIRVTDTEMPIEFWQEIVETFVGTNGKVFVPDCDEGNMLLGSINAGAAVFGFNTSEDLFQNYLNKVEQYAPGQYTSYPGSLSGKEEMEEL